MNLNQLYRERSMAYEVLIANFDSLKMQLKDREAGALQSLERLIESVKKAETAYNEKKAELESGRDMA